MEQVHQYIGEEFDRSVVPALKEYIKIPSQSPDYDAEWATNGLIEKALKSQIEWVRSQNLKDCTIELMEVEGRTPCLIVEVDATSGGAAPQGTILMYGHSDKQPPFYDGWWEGFGPYTPVLRDGRLYGRGASDDGYSVFTAVLSVAALQRHNIPHSRVVILIESGEESGSPDLEYYVKEAFSARLGAVDLVICLDSGCQSYDRVWLTSSLRGVTGGTLCVRVLTEGLHSGTGGGVVPDSFRIARKLLSRVEDPDTGRVLVKEAYGHVPADIEQSMALMNTIDFKAQFPTIKGIELPGNSNKELALMNFWKPSLTVVGANLPTCETAGNVIRPTTELKLSIRVPPGVDAALVLRRFKEILEEHPPHNAEVSFTPEECEPGQGFAAPPMEKWLSTCVSAASKAVFGNEFAYTGEGGSIPFMGTLGDIYPKAQFLITGVLGPASNAHGPNEMLDISFCKGITALVANVCAAHYKKDGVNA